ncbi:cytochrome P450 [Macrolepiota fuliginosa MF-IS2]|uniref:Cytochrome P450 n=1 Tax=Macrolepiota fuliginosa MF-IS2 TaxID=1400762 RepID=A0A9P5XAZ0_9AGAR|nr:cytochrome P450 [Macrolepiota fuliginosa MF-IS2]
MSPTVSEHWPSPLMLPDFLQRLPEVKCRHVFIAIFVSITYLSLYKLIIWPLFLSPLRKVPGPPIGNLILGQSHIMIRRETGIPQREWVKKYGSVLRIVGPVGVERLIFMEPNALYQILVKDWFQYPRLEFLRNILGLVTGYGLLTVTGDEHKQMRKVMNPAFSISNLMSQSHVYWDSTDRLVDILKDEIGSSNDGQVLPVYDWMSKISLDIICEIAFGYKANTLHDPHNELAVAYQNLLALQTCSNFSKLSIIMLIPGGPQFLTSDWAYRNRKIFQYFTIFHDASTLIESMHIIRQWSTKMLEDKLRESAHASEMDAKRDIISILVHARKAEQGGDTGNYTMNDQAMMDQVLTFLGAGHETTASGLTWTLWLLANDKKSQCKLREELTPILMKNPHTDYRTLKHLKWLDCVVMESLRICPPIPRTSRIAKETGTIDGIAVPKGTMISIPIRVLNTWKVIWGEDAEEFHPERWLNLPKNYNPAFSFFSFVAGPHACIGKTMAIMEMKTILAGLIVNFEFDLGYEGQKAQPATAITMKPTDGMPLRIKRVQRH